MLPAILVINALLFFTSTVAKTNEWTKYTTDLSLKDHTLIYLGSKFQLLFGGSDSNDQPNAQVYKYLSTDHSWQKEGTKNTPSARTKYAIVPIMADASISAVQRCFMHGGLASNGAILSDSYLLTWNIQDEFVWSSYTKISLPPLHSYAMASNAEGNLTIIFGGITTGGVASKSVYVIDWTTMSSNSITPPKANTIFKASDPEPTTEGGTLTFYEFSGGKYIFYYTGGKSKQPGDNLYLWKVSIYKKNGQWTADFDYIVYHPSPLPMRVNHHAYTFGPSLFLWGGSSSTSSFSVINVDQTMWYPLDSSTIVVPPLLTRFASFYDPERNVIVVHGGYDVNNSTSLSSTVWEYELDPCSKNRYCKTCTEDKDNKCLWCSSKARCIGYTSSSAGSTKQASNAANTITFDSSSSSADQIYTAITSTAESCTVPVDSSSSCPSTSSCSDHEDCASCAADRRCGWCREMSGYPRSTYGCFEGSSSGPYLGTCNGWAGAADTCSDLDITITLLLPSEGENIASGDTRFIMWSTFGLDDSSTVQYTITATYADKTQEVLEDSVGGSGYLIWYIPVNKEGQCNLTFTYSGRSEVLLTRSINLKTPKLEISTPKDNDVITDYATVIEWSDPQDLSTVYSFLTLQLEYDGLSVVIYETTSYASKYTWNIDSSYLQSTGRYNLTLFWNAKKVDGTSTPIQVAKVTNLTITLPAPAITITSPSSTVEFLTAGTTVDITWEMNKKPAASNLFLMEGNNKVTAIETIALNLPPTVSSYPWVVDVPYDSLYYFFRLEDASNTTYHGHTQNIMINASKLIVSFSDLPDDDQGHNRTIGDTINLSWDCSPDTSSYKIEIYTASNDTRLVASNIPAGTTSYSFNLPTDLKNDEICYIQVTANDIHPKLTNMLYGRSAPFRVQAIGALATPSVAATISLSLFAAGLIAGGILFYCLVYRRSRLSGFQQI